MTEREYESYGMPKAPRGYVLTDGGAGVRAKGSLPIPQGAMRTAPGCDALVWRIWPKDGSEL